MSQKFSLQLFIGLIFVQQCGSFHIPSEILGQVKLLCCKTKCIEVLKNVIVESNATYFLFIIIATFLWKLEDDKPIRDRRFFKRYLTFWHMYNLFADFCFLVGLLLKLLEILIKDKVCCDGYQIDRGH